METLGSGEVVLCAVVQALRLNIPSRFARLSLSGYWEVAYKRLLVSGLLSVAGLCFLLLSSSSASAATLNVVGGELHGASGVIVDGISYDVAFLDGTCIDLFSGCDAVSDFTFQSQSAAVLASQALLDQVFLDGANLFDTDPALTNGCSGSGGLCISITPFHTDGVTLVVIMAAANWSEESSDAVSETEFDYAVASIDVSDVETSHYAVWTPVPEPAVPSIHPIALYTLLPSLLVGTGLLALRRRSSNRE
jgi:hypothetical protein